MFMSCHLFNNNLFWIYFFIFIYFIRNTYDTSNYLIIHCGLTIILLHRQLTHGVIQKLTSSGRIADIWEGATAEISKRLGNASHNLVDRQGSQ